MERRAVLAWSSLSRMVGSANKVESSLGSSICRVKSPVSRLEHQTHATFSNLIPYHGNLHRNLANSLT